MEQLKQSFSNFFAQLDRDIASCNCAKSRVACTQNILQEFLKRFEEQDLSCVPQKCECYGRHLLYHNKTDGFSVVMMVWGPEQGTAIHDHGGIWCVEGVAKGELEITDYRLEEKGDNKVAATPVKVIHANRGEVGHLIPPFEHHRIRNTANAPAISIHVYGSDISSCTRYVPTSDGLYTKETVALCYDSVL